MSVTDPEEQVFTLGQVSREFLVQDEVLARPIGIDVSRRLVKEAIELELRGMLVGHAVLDAEPGGRIQCLSDFLLGHRQDPPTVRDPGGTGLGQREVPEPLDLPGWPLIRVGGGRRGQVARTSHHGRHAAVVRVTAQPIRMKCHEDLGAKGADLPDEDVKKLRFRYRRQPAIGKAEDSEFRSQGPGGLDHLPLPDPRQFRSGVISGDSEAAGLAPGGNQEAHAGIVMPGGGRERGRRSIGFVVGMGEEGEDASGHGAGDYQMSGDGVNAGDAPRWVRFEPPLLLQGGDLTAFLARALPGSVASGVEFIDRGVVNSNYRVELQWPGEVGGPGRVLLRLSRSDEGPRREGAIGERLAAHRAGLAPRLLATERGERPEPHRRSLFSWIDGSALSEVSPGSELPGPRAAVELGEALADLHGLALPAFGGLDTEGNPARAAARWPDDLSRRVALRLENPAHGISGPRLQEIRTGFARLLAPLWGRPGPAASLIHGDLSPGNIILTDRRADGSVGLAALVDWEMARGADPAADLASLRVEAPAALQSWVREVEAAYCVATIQRRGEEALFDWPRRVALAAVPNLLDARMVAVRRSAESAVARVDELLAAALAGAGRAT